MTRLLDTIREMVVAMARLEKSLAATETPTANFELKHVPPPTQFPHILIAPLAEGVYEIPTPGIHVRMPLPKQAISGHAKIAKPR